MEIEICYTGPARPDLKPRNLTLRYIGTATAEGRLMDWYLHEPPVSSKMKFPGLEGRNLVFAIWNSMASWDPGKFILPRDKFDRPARPAPDKFFTPDRFSEFHEVGREVLARDDARKQEAGQGRTEKKNPTETTF